MSAPMNRDEIIQRVNQTLIDEFEIAPNDIAPDKDLREDLELDSLDAVDMIVSLEQNLQLRVDEERAKAIRSIADVYNFVEEMLSAPSSAPSSEVGAVEPSA